MEAQTSADVVDRSVIGDLIALVETRIAVSVASVVIRAMCVDLLVGTQVFGLLRWNPLSPRKKEKFNTCGLCLSVCDISGLPLDTLSVCDNFDFPFDESGNLLNMIIDSGAEEHVVSLADWKCLGEPLLKPAQVRLRSATGDDMGVSGSFMVRGWCDNQMVGVDSFGGDSSYQVPVLSDEAGECWVQH